MPAGNPRRQRLSRQRGHRLPPGTISVARPTRWGNPFKVGVPVTITANVGGVVHDLTCTLTASAAVAMYRSNLEACLLVIPGEHPDDERERLALVADLESLRGHDLACWCPLDAPCHADVLLDLANR